MTTRRRPTPGFTLIELMIAVALSALVGILIYTVFIDQNRAFRRQADMGTMQQNLRIALEMLGRDLATAGFGTAFDGGSWGAAGQSTAVGTFDDSSALYGLRIIEDFPAGSGHDGIEILMMDSNRANWGRLAEPTPPCGATELVFHNDDLDKAGQFAPPDIASGSAAGSGAYIMCYAPVYQGRSASFLWQVSAAGNTLTGTVPVLPNGQADYTAMCPAEAALPVGTVCGPVDFVAYYIDDSGADGIGMGSAAQPVLYYVPDVFYANNAGGYPSADDVPVALGIEDLQFEVCLGGTNLDCQFAASWSAGMELGAVGGAIWENATAVRAHITARTIRPDPERTEVSAPIELSQVDSTSPSGGLDGYHRRTGSTEIMLRNATGAWQSVHASW
jgi:prepilin-type N-terminal cleavage/methylation domain-containing protein